MNYSRRGVQNKIEKTSSSSAMLGNMAGVSLLNVFLLGVVAFFISVICLGYGSYKAIIDSAPSIDDVNITPMGYATFVYDANGNVIQKLNSADGNRVSVSIDEIPANMQHAIVAIEDSRFYTHNGVDTAGMMRALAVAVSTGFKRTEGASTITQQLLKNNVFTDWMEENTMASIKRKIQEQYLAVELEAYLTQQGENAKEIILENYLNTVNFGSGCYGVETAAQYYFGKDCRDLTLSECAVLAAIPQNPTKWNPKNHPEQNKERQKTVLDYMLAQNYITQAEHDEALSDDVYSRIVIATETTENVKPYSYFVDEVVGQVKSDLMKAGYTSVQAKNLLYSGGLKIYTTEDPKIQSIMEEEFQNESNFPEGVEIGLDWALSVTHEDGTQSNYSCEMLAKYFKQFDEKFDLLFSSEEEAQSYVDQYKEAVMVEGDVILAERSSFTPQPEAAMTIIDQETGYVKGIVGGRGEKTASLTMNRAIDTTRQPGSTFKILSTYGPAIEEGKITLATTIADEAYNYADGTPVHNSDGLYHGTVTVRQAIRNSYNIVAVKVLTEITPQVGFDYLIRLGFTTLIDSPAWDVIQPLALGGITNGISNIELTAAYATIANGGTYIEPTFYTKVEDKDGNVILEAEQETHNVFSEDTCYQLNSALEDVVQNGTGTDFKLDNVTLAGKTGTTSSYKDLVFAGYTGYYTAAIWAGYDMNIELPEECRSYHKTLYRNIMNRIHEGLKDKTMTRPSDLKEVTVCQETGLLAGLGCETVTEYMASNMVPTQRCTKHFANSLPFLTITPKPTQTPTATPTPEILKPTTIPQDPIDTEMPSVTPGDGEEDADSETHTVTPDT